MELIRKKSSAGTHAGVHVNHVDLGGTDFPYLTFPNLEKLDFMKHVFTTRLGGVSSGALESLNFSYARGDEPTNVDENFSRVAKVMGASVGTWCLQIRRIRPISVWLQRRTEGKVLFKTGIMGRLMG